MKALINFCRIFVGSLFVVSGLIKANDPKGFSYKLEEYFAESALNLPFLEDYSLALAMLACLAEIVLGFAVIFGGKMKLATWSLLILTVFFGWLTLYTATCDSAGVYTTMVNGVEVENPVTCVTDCGCFGDAMKGSLGRSLTPWESFYKDAILFVLLIPIAFWMGRIKLNTIDDDKILLTGSLVGIGFLSWVFTWYFPLIFAIVAFALYLLIKKFKANSDWTIAIMVTVLALGFTWYCNSHLPVRDYRPYAVSKSITEGMRSAEELGLLAPVYATDYLLKHKETGEEKIFRSDIYSSDKLYKDWDFVESQGDSYVVAEGYEPPITDFIISNADDEDITHDILNAEKPVLLVISYHVEKASNAMSKVGALAADWESKGNLVMGLSASTNAETEELRHNYQLAFPFYTGDPKVLKTVVRSNPGLLLLDRGVIKGKWPSSDLPTVAELTSSLQRK